MKSHLKNLIHINGPISISQFMSEALFHPKLGYYHQQNPFGREGDFITAPEISQVFGELIGAYFIDLWQNNYNGKKINLVEMGAGRGTLMKDLLGFAQKINIRIPKFFDVVNVSIIEVSQQLQEVQKQNLQGFKVDWYDNFVDFYKQKNDVPIFFLANELFDCFAIDQFVKTKNGWAEKLVGVDKELKFAVDSTRVLNKNLLMPKNNKFEIGNIFEHSSQAMSFMNELSKAIRTTNGIGLIIDYGYIKNEFISTLQAVKKHQYCDILKEVGNCDITALVDFPALKKVTTQNNLQSSLITQREFLNSLGVETRRERLLVGKNLEAQRQINSAINRLIDNGKMGELFKVLVFWKNS